MRFLYAVLLMVVSVHLQAEILKDSSQAVQKVLSVKQSVLQLNRELYQLEEDLLSPATTQASIFLSVSYGEFFKLYSVSVLVDDRKPIQYLYTDRQLSALRQGAIQPLKDLNLGPGTHIIKAVAKGVDNNGQSRELAIETEIEKHDQPLYVELKIQDKKEIQSAELSISQW